MFDYLQNEHNPRPALVLDPTPKPAGKFVVDLPYATSLVMTIPPSEDELRAAHNRKYWSTMRRKERRLAERLPDLRFRVLTEEAELRPALAQVQALFATRWANEWTSFCWKTPSGFEPYAEVMVELARQGRGELAVLEGGGRLLSFAYCLREGDIYYFYQHASTPDPGLRPYSVGKLLVTKLIEDLVRHRRCETFDFMAGEAPYKLEWAQSRHAIYFRIAEDRSLPGAVRFVLRHGFYRFKFYVQFKNQRARAAAKRVLLARDRLTARGTSAPRAPSRPAGDHQVGVSAMRSTASATPRTVATPMQNPARTSAE